MIVTQNDSYNFKQPGENAWFRFLVITFIIFAVAYLGLVYSYFILR